MRNWLWKCVTALAIVLPGGVCAQGDAGAGQQKASACAACHGTDGNSANPEWPKLAGLDAPYIVRQLKAFKNGQRNNSLMSPQAQLLNEKDMQDLAAFYARQPLRANKLNLQSAKLGEQIYRFGVSARTIPACSGCHGPTGAGYVDKGFPRIGGQHGAYLAAQLMAYRNGTRITDHSKVMPHIANKLTEEEIHAVAFYASCLPTPDLR